MPNRIIKDEALQSKKLAATSAEGERLYWRLLQIADDHGRFLSDAEAVLSRCFPRSIKIISEHHVEIWLQELHEKKLIGLYEVEEGGDRYGHFTKWVQRVRNANSKFPEPRCGQLPSTADGSAHPRQFAAQSNTNARKNKNQDQAPDLKISTTRARAGRDQAPAPATSRSTTASRFREEDLDPARSLRGYSTPGLQALLQERDLRPEIRAEAEHLLRKRAHSDDHPEDEVIP